MAGVTTSYNNWNFNTQHVQQNLTGGDFVGSHTIIICASAPYLSVLSTSGTGAGNALASNSPQASGMFTAYNEQVSNDNAATAFAIPLGVVSDIGLQQQRQINKIYEIGSKLSYTVSARTSISISLSRVLYHGPSLLRMLYAYYPHDKLGGNGSNVLRDLPGMPDTRIPEVGNDSSFVARLPNIEELPGYDNIFLNAASDLFSQPLGLVMYIRDNTKKDVAAIFIEDCNLVAHQFGITQNSVVIAEGVQITADKIHPLKVNVASVGAPATAQSV